MVEIDRSDSKVEHPKGCKKKGATKVAKGKKLREIEAEILVTDQNKLTEEVLNRTLYRFEGSDKTETSYHTAKKPSESEAETKVWRTLKTAQENKGKTLVETKA